MSYKTVCVNYYCVYIVFCYFNFCSCDVRQAYVIGVRRVRWIYSSLLEPLWIFLTTLSTVFLSGWKLAYLLLVDVGHRSFGFIVPHSAASGIGSWMRCLKKPHFKRLTAYPLTGAHIALRHAALYAVVAFSLDCYLLYLHRIVSPTDNVCGLVWSLIID